MLRSGFVLPITIFALATLVAILPVATASADESVPVTIHEGADASTWGYTPATTTVAVGQTVVWTNSGAFAHDAAATDGSWKTPLLNQGASGSMSFSTPGTYTYICTPHPWMQGTIVVTAAPAAAPTAVPTVEPAPAAPPAAPDTTAPAPQAPDNSAPAGSDAGSGN